MLSFRRAGIAMALVLALGACSGGGGGDIAKDPAAALRAASRRTSQAKSVKMNVAIGSATAKLATGSGAFDFGEKLGRFKLATTLGVSFDLVLTADKLYLKNPRAGAGEKPWMSVTEETAAGSPLLGFLSQLRSQVDPRDALKNLGTSVKDVKKVGSEKIRGEDTTHLHGQVELSDEAIAKAPVAIQESMREAQTRFGEQGYPVDVWLDDDGRVRRFEYAMSLPVGGGATTITMDLFGYGEDPEIVLPKPDEVEEGTPQQSAL
ncbi:MAG TPA: LppX_LprAFG lipoprotein [Acidimicrobiales bacterium]|nr:LppX_LprAFG lipoprotein [Acidimicrobiales bacterium]